MPESRDEVWCFLVARRAVARACLHLGITSTSQEALDVMAAALLAYLERFSLCLSISTEASRRPTSNFLDALQTVAVCTTPAVQRIHNVATAAATLEEEKEEDSIQDRSWKGLACFMFGPDWNQPVSSLSLSLSSSLSPESLVDNDNYDNNSEPYGGKRGPPLPGVESTSSHRTGWCAPYPDKISNFPTSTSTTRKRSSTQAAGGTNGLFDYNDDDDNAGANGGTEPDIDSLADAPESLFLSSWGLVQSEDSQPPGPKGSDKIPPPPSFKRVCMADDQEDNVRGLLSLSAASSHSSHHQNRPDENALLLPNFLPPYPVRRRDKAARITVVEGDTISSNNVSFGPLFTAKSTSSNRSNNSDSKQDGELTLTSSGSGGLQVRSLLISSSTTTAASSPMEPLLQRDQYWGCGRAGGGDDNDPAPTKRNLSVPWGRSPEGNSNGNGNGSSAANASSIIHNIVPLGRASGSRVSRVLEGSMEGPVIN